MWPQELTVWMQRDAKYLGRDIKEMHRGSVQQETSMSPSNLKEMQDSAKPAQRV